MLYPAYIHHDQGSAYGASLPDFPGCFAAADDLQGLPAAIQEAIEVYFEGEDLAIPAPTDPQRWQADAAYQDGYWLLADVDLTRVRPRAVRLNISLPQSLVQEIDRYAQQAHMTRSGFLASAARSILEQAA